MPRTVTVAVPVPALPPLTYAASRDLNLVCGGRVLVPLGPRVVTGCVLAIDEEAHAGARSSTGAGGAAERALQPVLEVVDTTPLLPGAILELITWVAEYYLCSAGEILPAAGPPGAWAAGRLVFRLTEEGKRADTKGLEPVEGVVVGSLSEGTARTRAEIARRVASRARGRDWSPAETGAAIDALETRGWLVREPGAPVTPSGFRRQLVAAATEAGRAAGSQTGLTARQAALLATISGAQGSLPVRELRARGESASVLARLVRAGLVELSERVLERDPFANGRAVLDVSDEAGVLEPNAEQTAALGVLGALADEETFRAALLHGVTGSGKTEVYLRLAERVRRAGRSVLVLVPEIALTPLVAARFRRAFGDRVAIQHSGLSAGERHDQWHRIRRGEVDVVVGTRSAVFAPLDALGLIVVDEEHDSSYKQEESPRYNGRDVALVRGRQAGALVVLGSATPSLESYHNALGGRFTHVAIERRALDRPLAEVEIVGMREEYADRGPDVVLSAPLEAALASCHERQEQAVVLLNRRGYAPAVFCRECAKTIECPNCSVTLTVHRRAGRARCHYCDHSARLPETCPACGGTYLEYVGFGTERVESEIRRAVPSARVARLDRDTVRRRGAAAGILDAFARGEVDVLVGTQMVAKGHDFPRVTLVGVVSADVGLGVADFRAAERTFQLLTQVAGRAGRGERRGLAIIQTLYPEHYAIRHATRQDYRGFFNEEIAYRRAMRYPPHVGLVNIVVRGPTPRAALEGAMRLARGIERPGAPHRVLGPAPAPLGRLRGEHRYQIFVKTTNRVEARRAVRAALESAPDLRRRLTVDVDPVTVL